MADFLKQDVRTPFHAVYLASGIRLGIETNSKAVLAAADDSLEPLGSDPEEVRLRIWVEDGEVPAGVRQAPYFRGLGDLVFSAYCDRSSLLIDLSRRCGAGRLTPAVAGSSEFWKTIFFPSVLAILAPSVGLASLHGACVAIGSRGLLLVGDSGAGKSALSLALCQDGMDFLSDDRTLIGRDDGELSAWGLSPEMKQRPVSLTHFPELRRFALMEAPDGDLVYRFDPAALGIRRVRACRPAWIVFLEREATPLFSMTRIPAAAAALRLEAGLHRESADATERRRELLEELARHPCYLLRYGGNPHAIAGALRHTLSERTHGRTRNVPTARPEVASTATDPLRRFRATCLRTDVRLMGRHLRIETDNPSVMARVSELFDLSEAPPLGKPVFVWRIACEKGDTGPAEWPPMTAFCDRGLRYISLGRRGFLAADLTARTAVGTLPESLSSDRIGFATVFLASLLHLTAPALGLTAVSAACVTRRRRGLLLFGGPSSGKTTASYWASKRGMEFHADQATFLAQAGSEVRAWGDFWPAAFRPETARYLPELTTLGRPFQYGDRRFLCLDKEGGFPANRTSVTAAACIFLERGSSSPPKLLPLSARELRAQDFTEAGSSLDSESVVALLDHLPAYRLQYGEDPRVAALLFRSVLDAERLMEFRV